MEDRATTLSYRVTVAMKLGNFQAAREHCRGGLSLTADMLRKSDQQYPVLAGLRDQAKQLGLTDDTLRAGSSR
jgi:hypothetical protein